MKEFSTLNGYAVKDATAREKIEELRTTPQQFGAVADGVTDDTAAIQAAIDTGKDVYFPEGTYLVTGAGLVVNTENQKIEFAGGAWVEAKNIIHKPLAAKHVVKPRNTAGKAVSRIEKCAVRIGYGCCER